MRVLAALALSVLVVAVPALAQAQRGGEIPLPVFALQLLSGGMAAKLGADVARLVPWRGVEAAGGVLGAALGAGAAGALFGVRGSWLFGLLGAVGGWFISDYLAAGVFPVYASFTVNVGIPLRLQGRDLYAYSRALGTALFATVGFNLLGR